MRIQLGLALCLLAGCVVQPTDAPSQVSRNRQHTSHPSPAAEAESPENTVWTDSEHQPNPQMALLRRGNPMRIGVEFLPPQTEESAFASRPTLTRGEAVAETARPRRQPAAPERPPTIARETKERHTWMMSGDDLAAISDPIARETLRFIDDLMGEDRRRLKRDLGTPILVMQTIDMQSPGINLHADERQIEDRTIWATDHGMGMLRRPLRHLLKRLPMVRDAEAHLDAFKSDHVPLSQDYLIQHQDVSLGRVSARLSASDMSDPLELVYIHSGIRLASNQARLRIGVRHSLSENLRFELHTRCGYDSEGWRLRADLSWNLSERTSLHCVAGDDLDFLTTSTSYSLFDSPMDGSPGLLVYAVHHF